MSYFSGNQKLVLCISLIIGYNHNHKSLFT